MFGKLKSAIVSAPRAIYNFFKKIVVGTKYVVVNSPRLSRQTFYAARDVVKSYGHTDIQIDHEKAFLNTHAWQRARFNIRVWLAEKLFRMAFKFLCKAVVLLFKVLVNGGSRRRRNDDFVF